MTPNEAGESHPESRLEEGERLIIEAAQPRSVPASLDPLDEACPPIPELPTDSVDL